MRNIDKRALREAAEKALNARARLALMQSVFDDDGDDVKPEAQEDIIICVSFNDLTDPATVLALLDELEAKDKEISKLRSVIQASRKYVDVLENQLNGQRAPATDSFLAEVRENAITDYANKRGFSFQHGSIHAHFGNGDVMVGSVTFENGDAGINFAPVREKTGGVGTSYEWTRGKTAEQVDSVFVIASSNAEGLEVIRDKLSESIAQLRKGAQS